MKILVLADTESSSLWDFFDKRKLEGVDLILSCGDLEPDYLSFLATFSQVPILYVHGNHDDIYAKKPPEGCICIEDDIYVYKGIRILGLGGSFRYKPGIHQYSEREMNRRIQKLWFRLKRRRGFDILLTHAPAYQINDDDDLPHHGFQCFRSLLEKYQPKYFIHGHVHLNYGKKHKRRSQYQNSQIINGCEKYFFEYETGEEMQLHY